MVLFENETRYFEEGNQPAYFRKSHAQLIWIPFIEVQVLRILHFVPEIVLTPLRRLRFRKQELKRYLLIFIGVKNPIDTVAVLKLNQLERVIELIVLGRN